MTREEYLKERNIPINSLEANSINEGIDWAIEKAVKYLDDVLYEVVSGITNNPDVMTIENTTMEDFINNFRKAIEV